MKTVVPQFFIENKVLKTMDQLSYARYIQRKPSEKNYIQMQSNALIYVIKGTKILHLENNDVIISAGDVLFLRSGNYLMSEVLDEYYEAVLFFYSDSLLNDFVRKYAIDLEGSQKDFSSTFTISIAPLLQNGLLSILPYFEQDDLDSSIVTLKLEEIFLNILNSDGKFKGFLRSIYSSDEYFKTLFENDFESFESIKDMADYVKMNELNFREKFKTIFNTTPKKWMISKKLAKAKLLLQNSDLNVSEVCHEIGFDNISWFTQSFKKEFGVLPKKIKTVKN